MKKQEKPFSHEAYMDGRKEAQRHIREIVVATTEMWWTHQMNAYADGHWLTKGVQPQFCDGWKSITPPSFVASYKVTLLVQLMNAYPEIERTLSPLEQEMYHLFHVYSSMSKITFLRASKICFTYEIETTIDSINSPPFVQFFQRQLVSCKVLSEKREQVKA